MSRRRLVTNPCELPGLDVLGSRTSSPVAHRVTGKSIKEMEPMAILKRTGQRSFHGSRDRGGNRP
jgi:hypothetical protein